MNKTDIKEKLVNSPSVKSLFLEEQVFHLLKANGWETTHSGFYEDVKTHKIREIDIIARLHRIKEKEEGKYYIGLDALFECKTLKGYHLVFTPTDEPLPKLTFSGTDFYFWVGHFIDAKDDDIANALSKTGMQNKDIKTAFREMNEIAFPGDISIVKDFSLMPLPAQIHTTAFRETNVGQDKTTAVRLRFPEYSIT